MPDARGQTVLRKRLLDVSGFDPSSYSTSLSTEDQAKYTTWLKQLSASLGRDMSNTSDYDMQGAFKAGIEASPNGHFDDRFKKPNHMTFSTDSQYNGQKFTGGMWKKENGKWAFHASADNLRFHSKDDLISYFRRAEPDSLLYLPGEKAPAFGAK